VCARARAHFRNYAKLFKMVPKAPLPTLSGKERKKILIGSWWQEVGFLVLM